MRIVLSAGDFSQAENLKELGVELQNRGHVVNSFLAFGKKDLLGNPERASEEASRADLVLAGICDNNLVDLAVCRTAIKSDGLIKLAILSTGYSSHRHKAFADAKSHADLVILPNEELLKKCRSSFRTQRLWSPATQSGISMYLICDHKRK